ncbi:MAG: hypothetical protein JSR82_15865 [Verrucomicrobia bacterium]|nr:hypothetical protein [Verrucomicrobiota bacterium]
MNLKCIVTLGSRSVRLRLLALVRSLRATGCDLPVRVIPYNDDLCELPPGCTWWRDEALLAWLQTERAHPMMRKYQCLLQADYQYVDADVVFLRDPQAALAGAEGFVVCCGQWRDVDHALTAESRAVFEAATTNWPALLFNAGQFACDRPLFAELASLQAAAARYPGTCLHHPSHDQPGLNLLRLLSAVPLTNLTLPPTALESSWAGDYRQRRNLPPRSGPQAPYLLHWASPSPWHDSPVQELFLEHLTAAERQEWEQSRAAEKSGRRTSGIAERTRHVLRAVRRAWRETAPDR